VGSYFLRVGLWGKSDGNYAGFERCLLGYCRGLLIGNCDDRRDTRGTGGWTGGRDTAGPRVFLVLCAVGHPPRHPWGALGAPMAPFGAIWSPLGLFFGDVFEVGGYNQMICPSAAIVKLLRFWGSYFCTSSSLFSGFYFRCMFNTRLLIEGPCGVRG
jgi:hypothetical protein